MSIEVLIVDDHQILRTGLSLIMSTTEDIDVIEVATNGIDGLKKINDLKPDVILTDIRMPEMDGITMIRKLHDTRLTIPVVVLTTFDDQKPIQQALKLGAKGFLLKDSSKDTIIKAIRNAYKGELYIDPSLMQKAFAQDTEEDIPSLSTQDTQILTLVARGFRNREIAEQVHLSERTIKAHLTQIYDKLGVFTRAEAVAKALNIGIIEI